MLSKDRRELKKFLGKTKEYEGTIHFPKKKEHYAIIVEISHNGKMVADHVWVDKIMAFENMDGGTKIVFSAVAESYIDSHNRRKYGLKRCFGYRTYDESYDVVKKDSDGRRNRKRRR